MTRSKTEQRRLIESHQAGDPSAFPQIFKEHYHSLLAHARRRLGNTPAAEDAVQETFLRAFRSVLKFNGRYRVGAWLHRILENVCADEGNRRRGEANTLARWVADPASGARQEENEEDQVLARRGVVEALEGLPDLYRDALILRYLAGLSYREVAEATGVSEENARARVHRARKAINKILGGASALAAAFWGFFRRTERAIACPTKDTVESGGLQVAQKASQVVAQVQSAVPIEGLAAAKSTLVANLVGVVAAVAVPVSAIPALVPPAVAEAPVGEPPAVVVSLTEDPASAGLAEPEEQSSEAATNSNDASTSSSAADTSPSQTSSSSSPGAKEKNAPADATNADTETPDAEPTGGETDEPTGPPTSQEVCGATPSTEPPTVLWEGSKMTMAGTGLLKTDESTLEGWTQLAVDVSREGGFEASFCHVGEDGYRLSADFEGQLSEEKTVTVADNSRVTEYVYEGRFHEQRVVTYGGEEVNIDWWSWFSATFTVSETGSAAVRLSYGPELNLGSTTS